MNDSQIFTRSRRSSALSTSSSNIRQPTWKGSLLGRTTTPLVGVSTVLAEPELDSALSSASGILSSNSSISQTTVPEGDGSSNKNSGVGSRKAPATTTDDDTPSPPRIGLNGKSSLPNVFANSPSRRPRTNSSLFSSMSRAKGKESLRALAQNQVQQPLQPIVQSVNVLPLPLSPSTSRDATSNEPDRVVQLPPPEAKDQIPSVVVQPARLIQCPVPQHTEPSPSSSPPQHPGSPSSIDSSLLLPPAPPYIPTDQLLPPPLIEFPTQSTISKDRREPALTPQSTAKHIAAGSRTSPSSVDDRVPSLPPPAYSSPATPPAPPPIASILNPSSSRFTLSLPLFGRTKVPLETVSGRSGTDQSQEATTKNAIQVSVIKSAIPSEVLMESPPVLATQSVSNSGEPPNMRVNSGTPSASQVDDAPLTGVPPVARSSPFLNGSIDQVYQDTPPSPTRIDHRQHATWWEYVGWTSTSKATDVAADVQHPQVEDVKVNKDNTSTAETEASVDEGKIERVEPTHAEMAPPTTFPAEVTSPVSMSQRTRDDTGPSAWYAPWSWYGSGGQVVGAQTGGEEQDNTVKADPSSDLAVMFAQSVTQDVAVDFPPDNGINAGQHEPEPLGTDSNPIATSFESNTLGWASFFTTRMLVMKRISEVSAQGSKADVERDQNGMEVMNIDEDESVTPERSSDVEVVLPIAPPPTLPVDVKKETPRFLSLTPRKGNSGTTTPTPPSPASSVSTKINAILAPVETVETPSKSKPSATTTTTIKRVASPAPSKRSIVPSPPNLVLPTWQDTFFTPPRNILPPKPQSYMGGDQSGGLLGKTVKFVSGVLWTKDKDSLRSSSIPPTSKGKRRAKEGSSSHRNTSPSPLERDSTSKFKEFGRALPKAWKVFEDAGWSSATPAGTWQDGQPTDILRGCRKVVVIGVHGWFPGTMIRTVLGEPTGTSTKLASMMEQALEDFGVEHGVNFEKISTIPLEGEGTIEKRVERLYSNLHANHQWMSDLHEADVVIIVTHSQGCVVSTHLLDRLIRDGHIITSNSQTVPLAVGIESFPSAIGVDDSCRTIQKICCLGLCGIHLGPLRYLRSSTLVGPYLQYFESTAARELFEFQNTESRVSKDYIKALENVMNHGTKMVYVASLNDQVVPIYSGLFTAISHPLILRALYIDGDAYHTSDFLSNLLVLLIRILNAGISDSGLLAHLSEATAGSLNGVGHSTVYEELATYSLAVKYLFLTDDGAPDNVPMKIETFNASHEQNDYEIPWALRDIIADERVAYFFSRQFSELRDAFRDWHPKTSILRDLKRKLQPITRLSAGISRL